MTIEIDVDKIVKEIDIDKLIKEKIAHNIENNICIEDIVGELLDNKKTRSRIDDAVVSIIEEFLASEEGKKCIIEEFKSSIDYSDLLSGEKIEELMVALLKRNLNL